MIRPSRVRMKTYVDGVPANSLLYLNVDDGVYYSDLEDLRGSYRLHWPSVKQALLVKQITSLPDVDSLDSLLFQEW